MPSHWYHCSNDGSLFKTRLLDRGQGSPAQGKLPAVLQPQVLLERIDSRLTEGLWIVKLKKISLSQINFFFFYRKKLLSSLASPVTELGDLFLFSLLFSPPPAGICERSSSISFNAACWNQHQRSPLWDAMYGKACSLCNILPFSIIIVPTTWIFNFFFYPILLFLTEVCIACLLSRWWCSGVQNFTQAACYTLFLLPCKDGKCKLVSDGSKTAPTLFLSQRKDEGESLSSFLAEMLIFPEV